jgi:hypothetical protein
VVEPAAYKEPLPKLKGGSVAYEGPAPAASVAAVVTAAAASDRAG